MTHYLNNMFKFLNLNLFSVSEKAPRFAWRDLFEKIRQLKALCFRASLIVTLQMSKEVALAGVSFSREVIRLQKRSGLLFTALYLKQCSVSLQRYYAGSYRRQDLLSVPVSLTRSGIPRIIPVLIRKRIRTKSGKGDIWVKIYLSWFGLAKLIPVAKKVTKATFESISTPTSNLDTVLEVLSEMKISFKSLQPMYLPFISGVPLEIGMHWNPTWKSTPLSNRYVTKCDDAYTKNPYDKEAAKYDLFPNIFKNLKHEIAAFSWNINKIHSFQDGFFSPGILWYPWVLYPLDNRRTTEFANWNLDYFERCTGPYFATLLDAYKGVPLVTGRLAQVIEGGGKRRIFAICNYIKQCLLSPVHKWAMTVLSRIPNDGTFNQERPLLKLKERRFNNCYSFDLKSATDRWPLSVMYTLFGCLFGFTFASSVVNSSLGLNTFLVTKPLVQKDREISFLAGQPLGYHGSWSLFALSHHYIVWLAAKRAYPHRTSPFRDYALLGDDILITDRKVALEYRELLDKLGVKISEHKSIISETGAIEFAKKFWVKSMQIDLSPISLKALTNCRTTIGLCQIATKYDVKMSILQRLAGAGFRVRSRLMSTQSKRYERLKAAYNKPLRSDSLPLEFWIGRGYPLNPYLKGKIVNFLLKELKPRELQIYPKDLLFDGEVEILERTVTRNWVAQWLKWNHWYYTKLMSADVSLDDLMSAPMCSRSWKRSNEDQDLVKFGLIWKCYDMGDEWTLNSVPRHLFDPLTIVRSHWIMGGAEGNDFLMAPLD